jgi:glycosyltransferase involved in cell wall biosynthesis
MLWSNHQRPHHLLTQLARHHDVRCLFNDWTVREERFEDGRLIVTKHAFRRRYHAGPLVYYFSIPEKLDYLWRPFLRPDLLVFELMDLPEEEFAGWKKKLPEALRRADLVRTTHPSITTYLEERYADALEGKRVSTSYNGVDLELFDAEAAYPRPPELAGIQRPVLGFYGNLDGWIDWELLGALSRLPDYQVVVVGGTEGMEPKIPAELRDSSILWVGKRPVSRMPGFLAHFDVALYPFVVNEMTDAVDPLKVWEYLAFGRPVLASPTALVRARPSLFETPDPADLAGSVRRALATRDDPEAIARRRAAARERDWRSVADTLHVEILDLLAAGARNP